MQVKEGDEWTQLIREQQREFMLDIVNSNSNSSY
jgi:hypothetical protein